MEIQNEFTTEPMQDDESSLSDHGEILDQEVSENN